MKKISKEIILFKYKKINFLKNKIKIKIITFYFQNLNLKLKKRSYLNLIKNFNFNLLLKKKNLCLYSSRKRSINKNLNFGRHYINKLLKLGLLNGVYIH